MIYRSIVERRLRRTFQALNRADHALRFDIDAIAVTGRPRNTTARVEWSDSFSVPDGSRRGNQGVHALRLAWGKVVSLRVYCDTQRLAGILREMQSQGIVQAGFAPIVDATAAAPAQPAFAAAAGSCAVRS